jgi:hypothetical protein
MESSRAPVPGSALTRSLAFLVLALMVAAAVYGSWIALRYFRQIGV